MKLWTAIANRIFRTAKQDERLRRLERNDGRVEDLHDRAERIMTENHLGPAIRRALEGR